MAHDGNVVAHWLGIVWLMLVMSWLIGCEYCSVANYGNVVAHWIGIVWLMMVMLWLIG